MGYDYINIEKKWQNVWKDKKSFKCDVYDFSKPKYYILDMFPYPSGQGLHVGHPEGYTASDVLARMKRMQGYNVLHPMGWDSFGLPAEQHAMKTNQHPSIVTAKNIANFKRQINMLGFSYDWDKEITTSDPSYYKWTQWIFLKLYENNLAYVDFKPVNFCPELGTVLANEEVIDGKSEVGGFKVIRKPIRQWLLKIPNYADKLLEGLNEVDWPTSTLDMQRNWIGRSEGAKVIFHVADTEYNFDVFTTRVDTLFGCTYCVLAPEHKLVDLITSKEQLDKVQAYKKAVESKSDLDRTELNKEKTGVFTGAYAINPINNKKVPIYIADYVLASYGSGAVMAVPAHDERDYEFAHKYDLDIIRVIKGEDDTLPYVNDGEHINSDFADGLNIVDAKNAIINKLVEMGKGEKTVNYKLRDWLFSRQRYWGEPIPIVNYDDGTMGELPYSELPLVLPELEEYKPSGTGESPLVHAKEWLDVTINGKHGTRETNTMPQWAGSCWYYIRYLDPHNDHAIADPELIKHWLPVDLYIGGAEHAVLHLLYARFWHKFLYDQNIVYCDEPFKKLFHQGMILGENGEKMSKSRGNVVNPDDVVRDYGADSLRLYEMFMGPLEASLPWSSSGLDGAKRYLDRVYRLFSEDNLKAKIVDNNDGKLDYIYHFTVKKVTDDYNALQFNTAISALMVLTNEFYKADTIYKEYALGFIKMLYCIAPHLGEELWSMMGHEDVIVYEPWPTYDENKIVLNKVNIAISINGKFRATIEVPIDAAEDDVKQEAFKLDIVNKYIEGKEIKKIIFVKNKILNIVVA